MSSYPKWLYHPTKEAALVADEAAHKALGAGWYESPADFPKASPIPVGLGTQADVGGQSPEPASDAKPEPRSAHHKKVK